MKKYIIIDSRMREVEKAFFKNLGYKIIEIKKSNKVYPEISSHVDIFVSKIDDVIVCEKSIYDYLKKKIPNDPIICGAEEVGFKYPEDVKYNVCQLGSNIVHNFKVTDKTLFKIIEEKKLNKIQVSQGYSNCSISILSENSVITSDFQIAKELEKHDIDVLYVQEKNIKLLEDNGNYSKMHGFIGGAMGKIDNKLIVFGDLSRLESCDEIYRFIEKNNLELVEFKGLDVIDYGGIIVID